jgi:hypothetical protein
MVAYCTAQDIRDALEITKSDYDTRLTDLAARASEAIDRLCRRPRGFVADAVASALTLPGNGGYALEIPECITVTAVRVRLNRQASWESVDAEALIPARGSEAEHSYETPYNLLILDSDYGHYFYRGLATVEVTARWGYAAAAPGPIEQAAIVQASRWFKRGQGGFSDTTANADVGKLLYTKRLDPEVEALLWDAGYVRTVL